ncbi:MAG: SDR family oxidoreductase [Acidobacteria bacterium]|nr:MAG: SDR family oxidoreductase [Acidobacteriota bacterium]MCE7958066.1 SDR family oxidoreductase [Acidobacteria bacterium ACB2]
MSSVLITGCSSGIGRAAALRFAAAGWTVFPTARRPEAIADLAGPASFPLALDVTDGASIDAAVREARARARRVDVLVNNAGYGQMGPLVELTADDWRRQLETNVVGLMEVTRAVVLGPGGMAELRSGRIVNVGSVVGWIATPFGGAYCASKFAVRGLSDALRVELAPFGIEVVQVEPGPVRSGFGERATGSLDGFRSREGSLYRAVREAVERRARSSQSGTTTAEGCAEALFRAATVARPRTRYTVTREARGMRLLRFLLPDRALDRVLARRFDLLPDRLRPTLGRGNEG